MMPKMITIEEMTRLLGIGKTTAYKLVDRLSMSKSEDEFWWRK